MTTTASGLLCWRDSHPLEWQLASLHWSGRAPAPPAIETGDRADHLECDGVCDRRWRCLHQRPRLRRMAGTRPEANIDRGSHDLGTEYGTMHVVPVLERFHLEVRCSHPRLYRAEWMLDSLSGCVFEGYEGACPSAAGSDRRRGGTRTLNNPSQTPAHLPARTVNDFRGSYEAARTQ
jgi:hypothetical protein